jgi:hypothetical protein
MVVRMNENIKHLVFGVCITFLMISVFVGVASATTWHVDDDLADYPDADFTKIQDAVDAANAGDTIIVRDDDGDVDMFQVQGRLKAKERIKSSE